MTNADLRSAASMAVARMALDQAQEQGDAVESLLRSAAETTPRPPAKDPTGRLGSLLDVSG